MDYKQFINERTNEQPPTGITGTININPMLFDYQRDIVDWACRRGRAAIFADCGMGKTFMQLEWAKHVQHHTNGLVIILAPLAVSTQTAEEAKKLGIDCKVVRTSSDCPDSGIVITNYEKLQHFHDVHFDAVVIDESSILKAYSGKTKTLIVERFRETQFKLACTATPAPNDHIELCNHAEFLGIMEQSKMLAMFFIHDHQDTKSWRLKGHAEGEFWRWMASWAVSIRRPSDIGYDDDGFVLPELQIKKHVVQVDHTESTEGMLFRMAALGLGDLRKEQKRTVEQRAKQVAEIVNPNEPWIIWCYRNDEADALKRLIPDAVEIRGSDKDEVKAARMLGFSRGEFNVLITKPSIAGFGMNWQHCANVAFIGLSHSYEQYYQAVRRCWRFGQTQTVNCHIVIAETEDAVFQSVMGKRDAHDRMADSMTAAMSKLSTIGKKEVEEEVYLRDRVEGKGWTAHLGDCVDVAKSIESESVHCTIFSPPFASLYTYSDSKRDFSNAMDYEDFFIQFDFLVQELMRIMVPGRLAIVHCMQLPLVKWKDGEIGHVDFRGDLIRAFQKRKFSFFSEFTVWKDPVTAMYRTKKHGLLYKTLRTDSSNSMQGNADYVLVFKKPGQNPKPITHTMETFPLEDWQKWASPVWYIDQMDVLNYREAREEKDEKHVCPLQLDLIRRCLRLWSAEDDLVFSPFMGIGSEGYVALDMGRRFVGSELKQSYFKQAVTNLTRITQPKAQVSLFGDE